MQSDIAFSELESDYVFILEQLRECQDQLRSRNARDIELAYAVELLAEYESLLERMSSVYARALLGATMTQNL